MDSLPRTQEEVDRLDLSFINDRHNEDMIRDILSAVVRTQEKVLVREIDVWNYLKNYSPPSSTGFMFCDDEIVNKIVKNSEAGHSGSSFAWVMRQLEFIAKNGLPALKDLYNKNK